MMLLPVVLLMTIIAAEYKRNGRLAINKILKRIACKKSPCNIEDSDLCEPHPGQKKPVNK